MVKVKYKGSGHKVLKNGGIYYAVESSLLGKSFLINIGEESFTILGAYLELIED
jgi:hypothetical protein